MTSNVKFGIVMGVVLIFSIAMIWLSNRVAGAEFVPPPGVRQLSDGSWYVTKEAKAPYTEAQLQAFRELARIHGIKIIEEGGPKMRAPVVKFKKKMLRRKQSRIVPTPRARDPPPWVPGPQDVKPEEPYFPPVGKLEEKPVIPAPKPPKPPWYKRLREWIESWYSTLR